MDSKSGMEVVDKLIQIYGQLQLQLANCTSSNEVEALKRSLKEKSTHAKNVAPRERKMEEAEEEGREELGIPRREQNVGHNRLSVAAEMGKEVDNLTVEVEKLIARGGFTTEGLTVEVPRKMELPTTELVGEDSNRYVQEILEFLKMKEVPTIGVWGLGGVGKTSLLTHVYNYASKHSDHFGPIYWVTVSNDCSIHQLQLLIANAIEEDLSRVDDERLRAARLMQALAVKGKFTIILDDMWTYFDLNSVGISQINGCKLILTTRSKDVCDQMGCNKTIQVQPLQEKYARKLFFKSIEHEIPNDIMETATLVVKECGGLPLAIITLSRSMRKKCDIHEWRNVLNMLQKSKWGVKDMGKRVFDVLKLSFDRLNDSKAQTCLLHCATYPEDFEIPRDVLIWRFIDEGLLDMDANIRDMFDEGHTVLNELEGAALLSRKDNYRISMHDLIRDMALQCAGFRFMVKTCVGLEDFSSEKIWTDKIELVSLMQNYIKKIPNSKLKYWKTPNLKLKCWRLSTLLLQNTYFESLSYSFFENLPGLKVIDLSFTAIQALPKSILSLKKLTSLNLNYCVYLATIPNLSSLSSLRRLDFSYSGLTEVPRGVENLINLIYLNFFGTEIHRIYPGVFRRLTDLEVLGIPKFDMNVKKIRHLSKIEHVQFGFDKIEIFTAFVKHMQMNGRPSSYFLALDKHVVLGTGRRNLFSHPNVRIDLAQKCVELGTGRNFSMMLPSDVHDLDIVDYLDITSLCDSLSSCSTLKRIRLLRVSNLKSLFGSSTKLSSFLCFSNLRTLIIKLCPKINKLFSVRLLRYLENIEEINIQACEGLKEVIEVGNDVMAERDDRKTDSYALPNLITLVLRHLPKLESICGVEGVLECVFLQKIEISECPRLRRMPFSLHKQQPRVNLYSSNVEWVNTLVWDPPESKCMVEIRSLTLYTLSEDGANYLDACVRHSRAQNRYYFEKPRRLLFGILVFIFFILVHWGLQQVILYCFIKIFTTKGK